MRATSLESRRSGARRWLAVAIALAAVVLGAVPFAYAGGDFVDLAVGGGHVWFVGEPGVEELDATSGKPAWTTQLADAPYPESVTVAGGAAWVAGVQNGDVSGTLTRIDLTTHRARIVWRIPNGAIFYLATGREEVWALGSTSTATTIARFHPDGQLDRIWRLPAADDGRMTADASGCWISTGSWLLHINQAGSVRRVLAAQLGDLTAAAGAVWLPQASSVLRIDEQTRTVHTIPTGRLRLGGFQHDLAAGDNALWALQQHPADRNTTLRRLDPRDGQPTGSTPLPGIGDALVIRPDAIWVATVVAPTGRPATGYDLIRLDPHTLHRTLLVHIM